MFPILISVIANKKYFISVSYSDGTKGEIDLSHLAGKGIFKKWDEPGFFVDVKINEFNAPAWDDVIDLCPDSLFLTLKGISFEQWKQQQLSYASDK